jgi:hypothetical protein
LDPLPQAVKVQILDAVELFQVLVEDILDGILNPF